MLGGKNQEEQHFSLLEESKKVKGRIDHVEKQQKSENKRVKQR